MKSRVETALITTDNGGPPLFSLTRTATRVTSENFSTRLDWATRSFSGSHPYVTLLSSCIFIDRKSTRLNSSHGCISYAVFCLKKKNNKISSSTLLEVIQMINQCDNV